MPSISLPVSERPLVSVIIATRNRAALLARALDSVFSQWGLGVEFDLDVIVVDDASTDSTATVVVGYPQVRYLRLSTNRGVSAAGFAILPQLGPASSFGPWLCYASPKRGLAPNSKNCCRNALPESPQS